MSSDRTPFLVIISAPSGCGKTTLIKSLLENDTLLKLSISFTTRSPRPNEVDGQDYFFVDEKRFKSMISEGEFLEWAQVHGNYYGTSARQIDRFFNQGYDVILDIDVQGRSKIIAGAQISQDQIVSIFILPPSFTELERRLMNRSTESDAAIALRLGAALEEMKGAFVYDYLVFNDRISRALNELRSIVIAERLRSFRQLNDYTRLLNSKLSYDQGGC